MIVGSGGGGGGDSDRVVNFFLVASILTTKEKKNHQIFLFLLLYQTETKKFQTPCNFNFHFFIKDPTSLSISNTNHGIHT